MSSRKVGNARANGLLLGRQQENWRDTVYFLNPLHCVLPRPDSEQLLDSVSRENSRSPCQIPNIPETKLEKPLVSWYEPHLSSNYEFGKRQKRQGKSKKIKAKRGAKSVGILNIEQGTSNVEVWLRALVPLWLNNYRWKDKAKNRPSAGNSTH